MNTTQPAPTSLLGRLTTRNTTPRHAKAPARHGLARRLRMRGLAVLGVVLVAAGAATPAFAYPSSSGWTDGHGVGAGTGNGLVLDGFYTVGVGAYNQKWMGAYDASKFASGRSGEGWCVEAGDPLPTTPQSYSASLETNTRASYALWLANHGWNNPDGRAAVQYVIYQQYPSLGENWSYVMDSYKTYPGDGSNNGGRAWIHGDFTAGAKSYASTFYSQSADHNTAEVLTKNINPTDVPTTGTLSGIGVRDAWSNFVPSLTYSITISGPAVFDSTGTSTVTGTTAGSVKNTQHAWHATGDGQVAFTITYLDATPAPQLTRLASGGYQDLIQYRGANLTFVADPVMVQDRFQPMGTSQVTAAQVAVGDALSDTFTTSAQGGVWPIDPDASAYVPATYDVAAYFIGGQPQGTPSATVPGTATLVGTTQVTGTNGAGQVLTADFGPATQPGFYTFVWSFTVANQPAIQQVNFLGDWSDQFGIGAETTSVLWDGSVSTVIDASQVDVNGSRTISDTVTVTGFPSDHPTFAGGAGFAADTGTITHTLYHFAEGATVDDAGLASATVVGTPATTPSSNGVYTAVGSPDWIVPLDANGNEVPGTYVIVSTFTGDARVGAFATSSTDVAEQYVATRAPLAVSTSARSSVATMKVGNTVEVWDTAHVTGFVPVGTTISYELYAFTGSGAPACTPDNLLATLDNSSTFLGAGDYESEHRTMALPHVSAIGFVEVLTDTNGIELHRGACGAASETFAVLASGGGDGGGGGGLANTGANTELANTVAALSIVTGLALIVVSMRRRRAIA